MAISYLIGCGGHGASAVVDRGAEPDVHLRKAEVLGRRLRYVVDTHAHADHRSTGRALAEAAGAEYVLHADTETAVSCRGMRDGDRLELGNVAIEVRHVPGHVPEHPALLVTDRDTFVELMPRDVPPAPRGAADTCAENLGRSRNALVLVGTA